MNKKIEFSLLSFILLLTMSTTTLHETLHKKNSENIRLNQLGFYPSAPKIAIIVGATEERFFILSENFKDTVFQGFLEKSTQWEYSGESERKANFSRVTKTGKFVVFVPGLGYSYPFEINPHMDAAVAKASLKFFYYARCSDDVKSEFGGEWAREMGHPDTEVIVHPSAATSTRPAGTKISSPRGWYDAGDYNKYIVNSGIATYTILSLYEDYPKYFDTVTINIPESKNNIPDILDEALWNLRWMLTMQDKDGGVYHKLTNSSFDGSVMPDRAIETRYVVKKTTTATLDFAAVMAQSYRIFKKLNNQLPGFADSCLTASFNAWKWAHKNSNQLYKQSELNSSFNPDIQTGEYGDASADDELQWAALELFASTGKLEYYDEANLSFTIRNGFDIPSWQKVNTLGLYTLVRLRNSIPEIPEMDMAKEKIIKMASELKSYAATSPYGVTMGIQPDNFSWGSNSTCANQGMLLIQAYNLTNEIAYLDAAMSSLDYLLGRNPTGYSYITGFGDKFSNDPHHRPSEADFNEQAIPGMLVGGPNTGQEDISSCGGRYTSKLPALSYIDHRCSYASNEIAINWNAPFAYLAYSIEINLKNK